MCAFVDDCFFDTRETIKDDRAASTFHVVYGSLDEGKADGGGDGPFVDGA